MLKIISAIIIAAALPVAVSAQTTTIDGVKVPANLKPCYAQKLTPEKAAEMRRKLRRQGYMVTVTNLRTGASRTTVPAVLPASLGRGRIAESGC